MQALSVYRSMEYGAKQIGIETTTLLLNEVTRAIEQRLRLLTGA